jgi:hypothetical protein
MLRYFCTLHKKITATLPPTLAYTILQTNPVLNSATLQINSTQHSRKTISIIK